MLEAKKGKHLIATSSLLMLIGGCMRLLSVWKNKWWHWCSCLSIWLLFVFVSVAIYNQESFIIVASNVDSIDAIHGDGKLLKNKYAIKVVTVAGQKMPQVSGQGQVREGKEISGFGLCELFIACMCTSASIDASYLHRDSGRPMRSRDS